ncbi:hypothetical protein G4228_002768 [Cervus hanglu yarkandensis]|nr:hypothetical protein G4228_002768 [Cervus hanglu yarkandensis]
MAEQWELDEEGIRRLGALTMEQPVEVSRLQPLPFLKELDLRLNPVVRKDTDYRLFAVYTLQTLEKLDDRAVRESERKAAKLHFSQLGNSENFLLEVEKSSREKTVKNCVTNESTASKVSTDSNNRIETDSNKGLFIPFPNREIKDSLTSSSATQGSVIPDEKLDPFLLGTQMQEVARREMPSENNQEDEIRRYSPHQLTVRSPEKMAKEGYRISFLDKSSGSSPEKDLIPKPDTYQLTHDASLGKRLDVGDSSQIHPYQLPSDVGLENYDSHYSQNLSLHGSIGKRPQRNKNYREYSTKPSNNMKATTSHSCGDLLTSLSNPDSSTGRLLKLSSGPARDLLLTLVVPAPSQQWCRSHPEDTSKTFHRREMELKETGQLVPNDMESLKQKLVRVLEENLILSEKIQRLEEGATTSTVSGHPSHTYDDLLRKNQQLNMQVSCLNQELAQLKKLEETVTLLHESQRSLVVTNEYLLQQLNKEQKGYSGKALLPPEKSHHLGRSSPFGKSMLSSSSPVAHDMGQYLIQTVSDSVPEPSLWS